jgi:MoaA/NifB/PqqE/SkfB family radical SAM enzyme
MGAPKPWPTAWPEPIIDHDDEETWPDSDSDSEREITDDTPGVSVPLPEDSCLGALASVTWGVTHPCNLRCVHCYDALDIRRTDLTTTEAISVLDRLAALGVRFIAFSGGEPLLRKDLFQLLRHCNARHIEFSLRSNATRITPEIARVLADLGTTVVGVSLDGATAATHDDMRGAGAYARALAGIRALTSAGVRVNLEYVLSQRNAHESEAAIRLGEELGAGELNFSAMQPQGRARHLMADMLTHDLWRDVTTRLYRASKVSRIPIGPSCALLGTCVACVEPNVTCDGWVTGCYLSSAKLFHLLRTPVEDVPRLLREARAASLDVCGRRRFMTPSKGEDTVHFIPLQSLTRSADHAS